MKKIYKQGADAMFNALMGWLFEKCTKHSYVDYSCRYLYPYCMAELKEAKDGKF